MQILGKIFLSSLLIGTCLAHSAPLEAQGQIRGVIVDSLSCVTKLSTEEGANLSFIIFYENTLPPSPLKFAVGIQDRHGLALNASIKISGPFYKDGILDVSGYSGKGAVAGIASLSQVDACPDGNPVTTADLKIILVPIPGQ